MTECILNEWISKFRIINARKMSFLFFKFRIYFLIRYLFKLFEHSKYMIIYKIKNSWNVNSFPNCSIFKICYFSKLNILKYLMFFEIGIFGKFLEFYTLQIFELFKIHNFSKFQTANFWNFSNWKLLKFWKFIVFRIFQIANFLKFPNS